MELKIWEPLEAKYKPEVIALAEAVAKHIREYAADSENGWRVSEVSDFTDSDLSVMFLVESDNHEPIYLTFRLMDATEWDGNDNGTSFSLDIVAEGGQIVGGCHPFNYSDDVWVNPQDADAVQERWELFRNAMSNSGDEIISSIETYWNER